MDKEQMKTHAITSLFVVIAILNIVGLAIDDFVYVGSPDGSQWFDMGITKVNSHLTGLPDIDYKCNDELLGFDHLENRCEDARASKTGLYVIAGIAIAACLYNYYYTESNIYLTSICFALIIITIVLQFIILNFTSKLEKDIEDTIKTFDLNAKTNNLQSSNILIIFALVLAFMYLVISLITLFRQSRRKMFNKEVSASIGNMSSPKRKSSPVKKTSPKRKSSPVKKTSPKRKSSPVKKTSPKRKSSPKRK